ncbi:aldolase [Yamadazyma tenuis]|uniref:Aldolase n=1 Tax=Candida tenuis (strain ATCC 10573 / BCRC 21748 / CBS 615 / JCM 9827 / NBRC 10315 / NRRL Y-1498 / VKM Y-70) TaxID=590646 RepID=G3BB47_CANTC|nr:aldolase [Yamadazyma tenuis ATCC 10573]EGV62137.1 aldolase [Yamadazyma tenuis ATCC 10573]WEJ93397.1 aldolase [Yamadazyma tenuis]
MTKSITEGVYVPIVTFYKKDGHTIDFDTQIKHAKFLKQNGIQGIVALGSTGENALLSQAERIELLSKLHQAVPDFEIIAGVQQHNIQDCLKSISDFKKAGASVAMVLPSFYYGPETSQQGLIDWFTEVADNSELPVILYVYPGVSNGLQTSPETIRTLAKHPNVIGCKCSHGDVHQYSRIGLDKEVEANNFKLLSGQGQLLLPLFAINGKGVIDALSGCFPKTFVKLFKLVSEGKYHEARELQYVAAEAEVLASQGGFLAIKRAIKEHLGLGESLVGRKPMNHALSDTQWESYKPMYELIKKTEESI